MRSRCCGNRQRCGFGAVAGPFGGCGVRCAVRVLRSGPRAGRVGGGAQGGAARRSVARRCSWRVRRDGQDRAGRAGRHGPCTLTVRSSCSATPMRMLASRISRGSRWSRPSSVTAIRSWWLGCASAQRSALGAAGARDRVRHRPGGGSGYGTLLLWEGSERVPRGRIAVRAGVGGARRRALGRHREPATVSACDRVDDADGRDHCVHLPRYRPPAWRPAQQAAGRSAPRANVTRIALAGWKTSRSSS